MTGKDKNLLHFCSWGFLFFLSQQTGTEVVRRGDEKIFYDPCRTRNHTSQSFGFVALSNLPSAKVPLRGHADYSTEISYLHLQQLLMGIY